MPTEQQIMEWAAGGGFDPALGRAFVAQYGRLPSTLDEYTTFRGSQSGGQGGGYAIPVGSEHQRWTDQYGLQRDQYGNIALPQSQAQIRWGDAANQRAGEAQAGYAANPDVDLGQVYDKVVALWKAGGMPKDAQDPRYPDKNAYIQALQSYGVNSQAAGQMYDAGRQGRTSREDFVQMGTTLGANRTPTLGREQFQADTAYKTNALTGRVDGTNTLGRDIGEWNRDQQQKELQFKQAQLQAQLDANPRDWVQAAYNRAGQAGSTTPNAVRDMGAQIAGSPLYQGLTGGQGQAPGAPGGATGAPGGAQQPGAPAVGQVGQAQASGARPGGTLQQQPRGADVDLGQVYDKVVTLWKAGGMPKDQQDPRYPDKNAYIQALQSYGVNPQAAGQMYDAGRQGRTSREDFVQMGTTLGANRTPTQGAPGGARDMYRYQQGNGAPAAGQVGQGGPGGAPDQGQRDTMQQEFASAQAQPGNRMLNANPDLPSMTAGNRTNYRAWQSANPTQRAMTEGLVSGQGQDPGDWKDEMQKGLPTPGSASFTTRRRTRF